jgi:hypothetical protein
LFLVHIRLSHNVTKQRKFVDRPRSGNSCETAMVNILFVFLNAICHVFSSLLRVFG